MREFSKSNIRLLRSEIETALSTVARHHNIQLDLNTIRFSSMEGTFRATLNGSVLKHFSASNPSKNGFSSGPGSNPVLENALQFYGIPTSTRAFRVGGTRYGLISAKLSRPKYPFIGVGPQGGRYRFTVGQVKSGAIS